MSTYKAKEQMITNKLEIEKNEHLNCDAFRSQTYKKIRLNKTRNILES